MAGEEVGRLPLLCLKTYVYIRIYTNIYVYIRIYTNTCVYDSGYTYEYICLGLCIYTLNVRIYTFGVWAPVEVAGEVGRLDALCRPLPQPNINTKRTYIYFPQPYITAKRTYILLNVRIYTSMVRAPVEVAGEEVGRLDALGRPLPQPYINAQRTYIYVYER